MSGETAETRLPTQSATRHQSRTMRRPRRSASAVATSANEDAEPGDGEGDAEVGVGDVEAVGDRARRSDRTAPNRSSRARAASATVAIRPAWRAVNETGGRNSDRLGGFGSGPPVDDRRGAVRGVGRGRGEAPLERVAEEPLEERDVAVSSSTVTSTPRSRCPSAVDGDGDRAPPDSVAPVRSSSRSSSPRAAAARRRRTPRRRGLSPGAARAACYGAITRARANSEMHGWRSSRPATGPPRSRCSTRAARR